MPRTANAGALLQSGGDGFSVSAIRKAGSTAAKAMGAAAAADKRIRDAFLDRYYAGMRGAYKAWDTHRHDYNDDARSDAPCSSPAYPERPRALAKMLLDECDPDGVSQFVRSAASLAAKKGAALDVRDVAARNLGKRLGEWAMQGGTHVVFHANHVF